MLINFFTQSFAITPNHTISITQIIIVFFVIIFARFFIYFLSKVIARKYFKNKNVDAGRKFALKQLLKYFVYTISIIISIEVLGFNISILLAGSAALMVGIGLGLQQTFNDLVSGIILLFEGKVQVGDVVEISSVVGFVNRIGIRTSVIETRDKVMIIVPNSKLVTDNVINWSHVEKMTRFHIDVGVAYGSNVVLVKQVVLDCANMHPMVLKEPIPKLRFLGFGDSSLNFDLMIWTDEIFNIEDVKSDLRYAIEDTFRIHNITIPFPQRDLHIKSSNLNIEKLKL